MKLPYDKIINEEVPGDDTGVSVTHLIFLSCLVIALAVLLLTTLAVYNPLMT